MSAQEVLKPANPRLQISRDMVTGDGLIIVRIPETMSSIEDTKLAIMRALDNLKDAVWEYPHSSHPLLSGNKSVQIKVTSDKTREAKDQVADHPSPPTVPNTPFSVLR